MSKIIVPLLMMPIQSLPMQKSFTKRDAEYSKKVSATTVSRRKISKIFKFYGVYIML